MNDDFITTGLEADRYLKARQLAHDFETTLLDILRDHFVDVYAPVRNQYQQD